ncbi:PIN domain-containing protein [Deinococcus detaillensis]|uniref:PIN domain-containing protein n=1 Tax=Deinococcus detaillensis TaxID=2592048 RepID=A0A553UID6_9DEIO|nr:PIN domain-containing protein [Deinococcus detaillensis]
MAVYDASVLYPSLIRNLLMHLGTEGLVAARWTAQIHDEWTRNLLEDRPDLTPERLARTRQQMQLALPDAEVEGFEPLIATLSLPDPDDRHVLAAAVHTEAELIVTQNLKHFPAQVLTSHGLEALTPDALLCRLLDAEPAAGRAAVEKLRASFRKPPYDTAQLLTRLSEVGLGEAAKRLEED